MAEVKSEQPISIVDLLFQSGAIDVNSLLKKYDRLKSDRKAWETKWQIIQDQIFPNYRDYLSPNVFSGSERPGAPRTGKIRNHSSAVAGKINKVVSQINAQLTDPSVKWMDLKFIDPCRLANGAPLPLSQFKPARDWLFLGKEALYNLFSDPESNFYPSTHTFHFDWYTIGTACREIILRKDSNRVRFNALSMQDMYIELSGYGEINVFYRRFMLTAKQAYDLWGDHIHDSEKSRISEPTADSSGDRNRLHEYVEVSKENPLSKQIPSPPFMTCVIDKRNKHIVDVGLHRQHPYVVARFDVAPNEIYGRSCVWTAMPDILIINRLSKRAIQSADYATSPPILVRDITSVVQNQLTPNSFIQGLDVNGRPMMQPMNLGSNFPFLMEYYQSKLNDLDEALIARDIFSPEAPNMTATEVNERKIQANNRLRPILVRLEHEDLNKTVLRSFSLLVELGVIPPFPYEALNLPRELFPDPLSQIRVGFCGQMARMQRLQDIQNSDMLFQKTLQAAQADPSVMDRIKLEQIIMEDAEIYGVNPKIIAPDEEVQQIRAQRAQQQSEQAKMQQETQALDNIVKLKEAGVEIPTN
jgi:hypothetical protein